MFIILRCSQVYTYGYVQNHTRHVVENPSLYPNGQAAKSEPEDSLPYKATHFCVSTDSMFFVPTLIDQEITESTLNLISLAFTAVVSILQAVK